MLNVHEGLWPNFDDVTVPGFRAGASAAGIKASGAPDVALIASEGLCTAAGVFTTNTVKAACVLRNQAVLKAGSAIRAVAINAGNANACTGQQGEQDNAAMAAIAAGHIGCEASQVLTLSTGVIGVPLPMDKVALGLSEAASRLNSAGWQDAAKAIMTTDTRPKAAGYTSPAGWRLSGIAKGSGMIAPNMATMLAVLFTDTQMPQPALQHSLAQVAAVTFNRIVVDGDTSTNDTVLLLANGAAGTAPHPAEFYAALEQVCLSLAHQIVRDGEGATKFVTIEVSGAATPAEAERIARAVATSPLCKTAFYGADPNWGRIICAAGYSGAPFDAAHSRLDLFDTAERLRLFEAGLPCTYDESAAIRLMEGPEWGLHLNVGDGPGAVSLWTCDLSHDYVTINGRYRT